MKMAYNKIGDTFTDMYIFIHTYTHTTHTHTHTHTLHTMVTSNQRCFLSGPDHSHYLQAAVTVAEGGLSLTVSFCSVVHFERPASTADGRVTTCKEDGVTCDTK